MTKSFQKSAISIQELQLPHLGIITADLFDKQFELRCYKPSPDLQPFVVHIWTQRPKLPVNGPVKPPLEIASGPNIYLFFTPNSAFIHDAAKHVFAYDPTTSDVIAGVKFQPGGFYPFLRRSVSRPPYTLTSVFPVADESFIKKLLSQTDAMIVHTIETLLRNHHPQDSQQLRLVTKIIDALVNDHSLQTVSATARAFGMSERTLQLLFQTHVGIGVKQMITRRRLLEAIARKQNHPHPVWAEIAADLGYSSQSHFSRDFKSTIGLSPSDYLKNIK